MFSIKKTGSSLSSVACYRARKELQEVLLVCWMCLRRAAAPVQMRKRND